MFDNPQVQNEIEAYLLGLLYADGSILHKNTNPNIYNTIRIGLTSRDEDNLFRFNKYLNWNTCKSKSYIGNKSYDITYIANYSISFTKKMINLGIVPRKTYSNDDFVCSNWAYFNELIHTSDLVKYKSFAKFREMVSSGANFRELFSNGFIPIQQIVQYKKAYNLMKYGNMDFVPHTDNYYMSACLGEEEMPFKISDDGEILPDM